MKKALALTILAWTLAASAQVTMPLATNAVVRLGPVTRTPEQVKSVLTTIQTAMALDTNAIAMSLSTNLIGSHAIHITIDIGTNGYATINGTIR